MPSTAPAPPHRPWAAAPGAVLDAPGRMSYRTETTNLHIEKKKKYPHRSPTANDLLPLPLQLSDPVIYVASHMALVHNTFIRGLNTIYL